ncbi:phage tail protein [Clostridium sp. UBA3061]|uniref:phage tail protein n=1 Tax=Clostridium sp. UBA3061 TaxID=1946353 RepID=UPI003216851B
MLQLYDLNKIKIKGLTLYKDMNIESVLSSGDKTLSFLYPSRLSKDIKEECYIRTKKDEFVVKEISTNGEWNSIKATLNVENLEGQAWEHFDTTEKTISECLTLAVAGTGWTVQVNGVTKRRTIRKTNCSTWDIIQQSKKTYLVEIEFDTINKVVKVAEKLGSDKGVYFMDSLNLRKLDVQSNSYDFFTRIIAIGKDDLKTTIENFQYSSKKKTFIWKDERYTDENSLREDAIAKLEELSKPYKSYGADIVDLASINDKYSILSYGLGDIITLISKEEGIKEKQRIVKMVEYPDEPDKNTCEIANTILTFEDMQKEYEDTSKTVNNITSSNGTISEGAIKGTVEKITINKADIQNLNAVEIRVGDLEATSATITQLDAANANIVKLQADKADITELNAGVGRIEILESSVGDIQTLVNGNLTSNNIQSLILTSDKVTVVNGFIKNAMIENLDVSKINAGDISVNKFRIKSDSGNLLIFDNTIQIKDGTRVRVQIGKDASSDYNMYVWDSSGKLMFDATGLKADGIKQKIIRDDMVSDNANIQGNKLNISSVVTSINNGATTINSSKVLLDGTAQTLDVAFNTLTTKVDSAPPTIITDNSVTKLDGAIDGMLKINSIKGNTLQNVLPKVIFLDAIKTYSTTSTVNVALISEAPEVFNIKPNTEYTLIFKANYTNLTLSYFYLAMNYTNTSDVNKGVHYQALTSTDSGKIFKIKYTTTSDIKKIVSVFFGGKEGSVDIQTGGYYMMLEGDWTNKEIPYFEGIRSVSENGEASEIVSKGENLLDINKIKDSGKTRSDVVGDTVTVSSFEAYAWLRSSVECKVKPNTDYYCDFEISDTTNGFVNINTPLGFLKDLGIKGGTFNSGNNSKIIIGLYATTTTAKINNVTYSNLRLTEGNTSKPYEPYKEHRQLITLTNPLRGLPNGVRDTAKENEVTRNVGKGNLVNVDSWNWERYNASTNLDEFYTRYFSVPIGSPNVLATICDTLPALTDYYTGPALLEGVSTSNAYAVTRISLSRNKTGITDTDDRIQKAVKLKAWLQANPVTIYYQLATPVKEPISVEQYMKQFKDGYFLTEGSLINPIIDLTYSTSLASALSTMKEVTESNTTALNIQQGKISALISNTTIVKDGQNIQLKDAYNSTVATVNAISSVISSHTSNIDALTGQITSVETKTNEVRRDLDGIVDTVSKTKVTAESALSTATEAKQTADGFTQRVSNIETNYATTSAMNSAISQKADSIKLEVSKDFVSKNDATLTYATKASMELTANQLKLDFFSIDIINLLSNSSFSNRETTGWNMSGIGLYTGNANFFMPTDGWRAFSLTSDRGLLYQKGMIGERLPKRNSQYTFSLSSITESNVETFRLYIDYKLGASYVANQVINLKTGYNINRYSVTFTTKDINYDTFLLYIEVKPKAGTTGYRVFSIGLPCLSKGENGSYTARQNEVISGSTEIDANGVTIYNGAIDVRNRAGNSVLKGDANGNLMVRGNLYADPANPILHLFGGCSIDATYNNEQGVGSAVRLKWDENSYIRIDIGSTDIYQNGIARFRFHPNYLDCKPPTIYFADQCKIDASSGTFRFYISKSVDTGIRISPDGTISFMIAGTPRHVFNTNGTKAGGTIVVDGATLGMSPIDSPKVLLEDVLFDIDIQEEGTTVSLDSTFLKTISTYAVFSSNPGVIIVSKDRTSFTVRGYNGKVDFRVIGYRIGYEEQYYQVVG